MNTIAIVIYIVNAFLIIAMIFKERKKPEKIVSWLLLFSFLPIIGFIIYVLFGSGISLKNRMMLSRKQFYNNNYINYYRKLIDEKEKIVNKKISSLIRYNLATSKSVPTFNNHVHFFTNGKEKIESLIKDLLSAKHSINMEYYIWGKDKTTQKIINILIEKAKQGVSVNVIYDSVGSLKTPRRFFRQLKKAGGCVKEFFPPLFYIRLINLKMNYRNHRKIVVIDGKIGYVGGINIREDHMGKNPKVSPWLDAHIRIQGQAVYVLQNEFLNFWQFCNKKNINTQEYVNNGFFPEVATKGKTTMQIVSSGPDSQKHEIKDSMVKLIQMAEKEIIIQTPYFIPDEVFINALKTAISSGVKVKLMLPGKPDKKMIYFATMSFAREFLEMGGEVYLFKGFVHAKTIVVDNFAMTLGTANIDNRSFNLNFEINAILYDKLIVTKYLSLIKPAFDNSKQVDLSYYTQKSWWTKTKQLFFRLFSPLM